MNLQSTKHIFHVTWCCTIRFLREDWLHGIVFNSGHVYEKQFQVYILSRVFSLLKNSVIYNKKEGGGIRSYETMSKAPKQMKK